MFGFIDSILRNTVKLIFFAAYYLMLISINILLLPFVLTRYTGRAEVGIFGSSIYGILFFGILLLFEAEIWTIFIVTLPVIDVIANMSLSYSIAYKE